MSLSHVLPCLFALFALVIVFLVRVLLLSPALTLWHFVLPLFHCEFHCHLLLRPESDLVCAATPTVPRLLATVVTDPSFESAAASALVTELVDFAAACHLDDAASLVAESESDCPPSVGAAVPHLVAMLLAPEGDPDPPNIPTPCSYAEEITGPYSSQWQTTMDADMASWKSTCTYIDTIPPPGANIVDGVWIFKVKRPPGSPPVFKARYVARGFSQRQGRDYELHSLDFSTAFLQGSLHEEIWLRRPPGFTGSFLAGTQWILRRQVYGLRQAPREGHDTVRMMLVALGFAPSSADPSTDMGELRNYFGLQITRDRARRTITLTKLHMVHEVLQRFGFQYFSPQSTPLPTGHSLSAPRSDKSVVPSGPYPELVGCLIYLMTCTRSGLAYPLSILARYVAPGRHRPEHWEAAKRVLRYLCSTSGMGLVLGGRGPVVLTGHADASWELRWLTYLQTDLGEQPCSPPVLYVDNKAMIALCQVHRLEHRTKHIALRYFLARELQQRGKLRLAYVASRTNTADIFTKVMITQGGAAGRGVGRGAAGRKMQREEDRGREEALGDKELRSEVAVYQRIPLGVDVARLAHQAHHHRGYHRHLARFGNGGVRKAVERSELRASDMSEGARDGSKVSNGG
ncbi:unnamed protein product [Closterium sp. NIES-54]